jgi:hypothetical protein
MVTHLQLACKNWLQQILLGVRLLGLTLGQQLVILNDHRPLFGVHCLVLVGQVWKNELGLILLLNDDWFLRLLVVLAFKLTLEMAVRV